MIHDFAVGLKNDYSNECAVNLFLTSEPLAKLSGMKEFLGVAAGFMGWVLAGDGWANGLRHFLL